LGVGIYDNDDAVDWAGELPESGLDAVRAALEGVLDADWRVRRCVRCRRRTLSHV
jgi:hypothetical protein